jgi:O-acetylhomoserine/O-acetylserine sulfhydrylase-like pyridoxal-dependent enzyme
LKLHTKVVHTGDRKKAGQHVPVTTPIHTAASYFYESMDQLDRVFGQEEKGFSYARTWIGAERSWRPMRFTARPSACSCK